MAQPKKRTSTSGAAVGGTDIEVLLKAAGVRPQILRCNRSAVVFAQGAAANAVFCIRSGDIKLSVVSAGGKEAVVALLGPGDFFGEGCLAGQPLRMSRAKATTTATFWCIAKTDMESALHQHAEFSERFLTHMLRVTSASRKTSSISCSTRARSGWRGRCSCWRVTAEAGRAAAQLPKMSQEMLAEMVGTTRSRVNFFMNKFRKLGFIEYNGGIKVKTARSSASCCTTNRRATRIFLRSRRR